jgi:hypothetical protein
MRWPGVERVEARMAGGDDTVGPFNTHLPVVVRGESGNDTYVAGNPSFLTNVNFVGGVDVDTASYAGSGQGPGGRGVRIANDGFANDGRIGLDTDNIGRDVENLTGSPFADEITGTGDAALRCCVQALTGGQGDDVLRAGGGHGHDPLQDGSGGRWGRQDHRRQRVLVRQVRQPHAAGERDAQLRRRQRRRGRRAR